LRHSKVFRISVGFKISVFFKIALRFLGDSLEILRSTVGCVLL